MGYYYLCTPVYTFCKSYFVLILFFYVNNTICGILGTSVVAIPNVAMRYVSRYLGHDAIRIAILVIALVSA